MAGLTHSKLLFLIYLQYVCTQFCVSLDDIAENFEEAAIVENYIMTTNSELTTKEVTTLKTDVEVTSLATDDTSSYDVTQKENITMTPINETTTTTTIRILQNELKNPLPVESVEKNTTETTNLCPYFIYNAGFRMEKLPDVWQPVYYNMEDTLKCFKLQIKKTSNQERKEYEKDYGSFNGSVDWNECHFEIKSSSVRDRKHFLQGGVGDMGVMRNIVMTQDDSDNFILKEESPDQWLMLRDLLVIRDCATGGTVVLARVPRRPRSELVRDALAEIGEEMVGETLCEDTK